MPEILREKTLEERGRRFRVALERDGATGTFSVTLFVRTDEGEFRRCPSYETADALEAFRFYACAVGEETPEPFNGTQPWARRYDLP